MRGQTRATHTHPLPQMCHDDDETANMNEEELVRVPFFSSSVRRTGRKEGSVYNCVLGEMLKIKGIKIIYLFKLSGHFVCSCALLVLDCAVLKAA